MEYAFDAMATQSLPIEGESARFPLRRIFCVGRNYADHIREMGFSPEREAPFFFTKPIDAIVQDGSTVPYPSLTENLHHEAELVIAIGKEGSNIPVEDALEHVFGYAAGNDLTRRDLQFALRDRGRPWDWSKGFDNSAPCGPIQRREKSDLPAETQIQLTVNGELRQDSTIGHLIWSIPEIIAALSSAVRIKPGDLVYSGTPAGVGPLVPGDVCTVTITGLKPVTTTIGPRE